MREYKIAKGWAIFIYIFGPALIGLFVWLLIEPFFSDKPDPWQGYWIMAIISPIMIGLMIVGLLDLKKLRLVIADDRIYTLGVLPGRQLMFDEIKGYRTDENYTYVEPLEKGKKRIKITKYLGRYQEIVLWLEQRYPDLDLLETAEEQDEILKNDFLGVDMHEREKKLEKARKLAKIMNWSAGLLAAWAFFWPKPYGFVMMANILVMPVCIVIMLRYKGLFHLDEKKNSAYPSLIAAMFFSTAALVIRVLLDYNVLKYDKVWNMTAFVGLLMGFLIVFASGVFNIRKPRTFMAPFFITLLMGAYAFGAIVSLNCTFDPSSPELHRATITGKRIDSGEATLYYLDLSAWGPQKTGESVKVTKEEHDRAIAGNTIDIYLYGGLLDVPWVAVVLPK